MADKIEQAIQTMIQNLKEKTGKSLEEWVKIAKASKLEKHSEVIKFLKTNHGLGHGYANLVAHTLKGQSDEGKAAADDPVAAQYAGEKAGLKPIYDTLIKAVTKFGKDVEISPKKTYVSLRRNKQFALIQPTTKTRVDVGINLKGVAPAGKLEASGSFNAMVSHRVRVETANDVDKDLIGWLKQAYEQS
ncbi:MAG TPA: DUF4287 domain-containing protein [Blastocatellia bacterium]|nr:DUF4287 domain-containing protein [Blastocatellia bacterium]